MQGSYSETGYGPIASVATVNPTLTYEIDVSPIDTQTTPPYLIDLSSLYPGSVITSSSKVWVSLDTNATSGGSVFLYGLNGGLKSSTAGYTISAVSGDLGVLSNGFGAQGVGATQISGGPFNIDAFYSGSGNVVGMTDTLVRQMFYSTTPMTSGRANFVIKAKSDNNVPEAGDYTETLTVIAAANY